MVHRHTRRQNTHIKRKRANYSIGNREQLEFVRICQLSVTMTKHPSVWGGADVLLPIIPAPWRSSHENPEFEVSLGYTANSAVLCRNEALEPWDTTRPSWPQFHLGKPSPQGWRGAHTRAIFCGAFAF